MPEWEFAIAPPDGSVADTDLGDCRDLKIVWDRSKRGPTLTGTVPLESDAMAAIATHLQTGLPILTGWRDGTIRFRGVWMPMREALDGDKGDVQIQFAPHARLQARYTDQAFTGVDAGAIAQQLLGATNGDSQTGLTNGGYEETVTRDRTYADQLIMDAIEQLAGLSDGFDFEIVPYDNQTLVVGQLHVVSHLGADRTQTVVFEAGEGTIANVASVDRQTTSPVNRAVVIAEQSGSSAAPRGTAQDTGSITTFGLFEHREQATEGTVEQATLTAAAQALLSPQPGRVVGFQPAPDSFSPWDDYWLGDTISLVVRQDAMNFNLTPRVNHVEVQPYGGDDGRELVTVGIDQET